MSATKKELLLAEVIGWLKAKGSFNLMIRDCSWTDKDVALVTDEVFDV